MGETAEFKAWAVRVGKAALEAGFAEVVEQGRTIAADIKASAPRRTGRLANSVRMEIDPGKLRVIIRAGGAETTVPVRRGQTASYDYALAQEWGTQKLRAHPFFFPTWRRDRIKARRRINAAIKQKIEAVK